MNKTSPLFSLKVATFDRFSLPYTTQYLSVNLRDDDVRENLFAELETGAESRYQFISITSDSDGALVEIVRVLDRWWVFEQLGDRLQLFGIEAIPEGTLLFEFVEPIWELVIFLPWDAPLDDASEVSAAIFQWLDHDWSVEFSQIPRLIGVELAERHKEYSPDLAAYDKAQEGFFDDMRS